MTTGAVLSGKVIPGPRQYIPLPIGPTTISEYKRDPLRFYLNHLREYGDLFKYKLGPFPVIAAFRPEHVQHVLEDRADNYPRSVLYYLFEVGVGKSLITNEGDPWHRSRRMAEPAFDQEQVPAWVGVTTETTATMIERWRTVAKSGRPLDIFQAMLQLVLGFLGKKVLGTDLSGPDHPAGRGMDGMKDFINWRFGHLFGPPPPVPTPRNVRFLRARRDFDTFVYGRIAEYRREPNDRCDILSRMLLARDVTTGAGLSDQQLRHEMASLLLAGYEATASLLAFALYHISMSPSVASRLRSEVAEVLGGRPPTAEDLPKLTYTKMVVQETLRLYPGVWMFARAPIQDDELSGFPIPVGHQIILSPYVTHRLEAHWPNPEAFDPERFTTERSANRHPYAFFPFCGGPHRCLAYEFAVMAAQLVLAMVTQAYRLHLVPGHPVAPVAGVVISPREGILMTVHPA